MRIFTAHIAAGRPPVLVREGFAWGALVFGPLWLLRHRLFAACVVALCLGAFVLLRLPAWLQGPLLAVLHLTLGVFGNDLRRESLGRRGYAEAHVLAASSEEGAYARLLTARPDIAVMAAR